MCERIGGWLRAYAEKDGRGYPDWAARYIPIVNRIERRLTPSARIVEIGANATGLARFIRPKGRPVIAVDLNVESLQEARAAQPVIAVAANAGALPFRDHSIDVCVCVDTYEHLTEAERRNATAEILRVLHPSGMAVIAFPAGEPAAHAEAQTREAYRRFCGGTLAWLEEHSALGLPDADTVARAFAEAARATHDVTRTENCALWAWRWMWRILMCGWPGRGNAAAQAMLRLLTPLVCRLHAGTCYRTVIWVEPKIVAPVGESRR